MKQIVVAQIEYFKVRRLIIFNNLTYLQRKCTTSVLFSDLITNKLFFWETNAPIGACMSNFSLYLEVTIMVRVLSK